MSRKPSYFLSIIFLIFIPSVNCQAQMADSLLATIPHELPFQKKIDTLNTMGFDLIFTDPTEARIIFNEAITVAESLKYDQGLALALKNKAISYDIQGNSNQAIVYYLESLSLLEALRDTLGISRLKNNLGIAYKNLNDLETARKFYEESITLKELLGDVKGVAYGLNNVGELFQRENNYPEALDYFTRAHAILDSLRDIRGRSITLSNLAVCYLELKDYNMSIDLLLQSMKIDEATEDLYSLSVSYNFLTRAYLETNRISEGLVTIEKAGQIAMDIGALKTYYDSQTIKAELLRRANKISLLPDLYEEILALNDSLAKINVIEETAKMRAIYESREKELLIEDLKNKSDLNEKLIATQNRLFNVALMAASLLAVLVLVVLSLYKKVRKRKSELEVKIIERDTAKNEAELANQAKSQFLAQMSHEIRTPLNAIIGYTDQLIEMGMSKTQKEYLEVVNQSALGLLGIINGILDLSKLEAGKLELIVEHTDLFELCNHVVQMTSYKADSKNLKIVLNNVDRKHRFVLADEVRLRQVLVNLLANAVKFTEEGEIQLNVEVLGEDKDGKCRFRFSVVDTGIGIKPENLKKIFQAFSQEDSSTTRKYGGTGLGLSISNILLSLMDSKLEVNSEPGKGSTFSFDVSFELVNSEIWEELSSKSAKRSEPKKVISKSDKLKVLVAEDNANNMVIIKMMLKKALPNSKIIEAANGIDAVELYTNEKPDVVLMDVQMPEMDGYDATREIRKMENDKRTPIVAITAGSMTADKEKCYEAGMDDFISKPIVNDSLTVTLSRWIREEA